jgi:hypothetical protein
VSSTGSTMWLVCTTDGQIVPTEPPSLRLPSGLESGQQLAALLDDCEPVLCKLKPARVVLHRPTYSFLHTIDEGNTAICHRGYHDIYKCEVVQKRPSPLRERWRWPAEAR